ncbi:hypothetical protein VOLCADRAFT_116690, partial [Volvox carteri f. nagariensis]
DEDEEGLLPEVAEAAVAAAAHEQLGKGVSDGHDNEGQVQQGHGGGWVAAVGPPCPHGEVQGLGRESGAVTVSRQEPLQQGRPGCQDAPATAATAAGASPTGVPTGSTPAATAAVATARSGPYTPSADAADVAQHHQHHHLQRLRAYWHRPLSRWDPHERLLVAGAVVAAQLRSALLRELGYSCSAGVAHYKLMAKLGSGLHKPNQQTVVLARAVPTLLRNLPLAKLRSLGPKFGEQVQEGLGIQTLGELWSVPASRLESLYGPEAAAGLMRLAAGMDEGDMVSPRLAPKTLSCGKTFRGSSALQDIRQVSPRLMQLAAEMSERIEADRRDHGRLPTQLTLTLQTGAPGLAGAGAGEAAGGPGAGGGGAGGGGNGSTHSRSCRLARTSTECIAEVATGLVRKWAAERSGWRITGLSITTSRFDSAPSGPSTLARFLQQQQQRQAPQQQQQQQQQSKQSHSSVTDSRQPSPLPSPTLTSPSPSPSPALASPPPPSSTESPSPTPTPSPSRNPTPGMATPAAAASAASLATVAPSVEPAPTSPSTGPSASASPSSSHHHHHEQQQQRRRQHKVVGSGARRVKASSTRGSPGAGVHSADVRALLLVSPRRPTAPGNLLRETTATTATTTAAATATPAAGSTVTAAAAAVAGRFLPGATAPGASADTGPVQAAAAEGGGGAGAGAGGLVDSTTDSTAATLPPPPAQCPSAQPPRPPSPPPRHPSPAHQHQEPGHQLAGPQPPPSANPRAGMSPPSPPPPARPKWSRGALAALLLHRQPLAAHTHQPPEPVTNTTNTQRPLILIAQQEQQWQHEQEAADHQVLQPPSRLPSPSSSPSPAPEVWMGTAAAQQYDDHDHHYHQHQQQQGHLLLHTPPSSHTWGSPAGSAGGVLQVHPPGPSGGHPGGGLLAAGPETRRTPERESGSGPVYGRHGHSGELGQGQYDSGGGGGGGSGGGGDRAGGTAWAAGVGAAALGGFGELYGAGPRSEVGVPSSPPGSASQPLVYSMGDWLADWLEPPPPPPAPDNPEAAEGGPAAAAAAKGVAVPAATQPPSPATHVIQEHLDRQAQQQLSAVQHQPQLSGPLAVAEDTEAALEQQEQEEDPPQLRQRRPSSHDHAPHLHGPTSLNSKSSSALFAFVSPPLNLTVPRTSTGIPLGVAAGERGGGGSCGPGPGAGPAVSAAATDWSQLEVDERVLAELPWEIQEVGSACLWGQGRGRGGSYWPEPLPATGACAMPQLQGTALLEQWTAVVQPQLPCIW